MRVNSEVRYRIDADDCIAEVNDAWVAFAEHNNGPVEQRTTLGRSIWDSLADRTTVHLYQAMVERVRADGTAVRFCFRCDALDRKRLLGMEITPALDGAVDFRISTVAEEAREAVALLTGAQSRDAGALLTMCSWCKRVRLPNDEWVQVEQAVQALGLFGGAPLPHVTHGICPACSDSLNAAAYDSELGASGTLTLGAFDAL